MSKSKKVKYDMTPYKDYKKYLQNYDTSKVDSTIGNMESAALDYSSQLGNMGQYNFSADGSDEARQRAENAVYQSFLEKATPQFEQQTDDLQTRLINQGLTPGSEAYQRAMNDLQENQNDALSQAAYQAVLQGQDAFSQSLADEINAGSYGNSAQQNYINLINSMLANSVSGYENQQNIFSVGAGKSNLQYQQDKANAKGGLLGGIAGAISGAASGSSLGPWGTAAGGLLGGWSGYN